MIFPATTLIKNVRRMEEMMARSLKAHTENCFQQAEAGVCVAQLQLGLMYSTGQKGALLDYVAAHKWLNLAALRGNDEATLQKGDIVVRDNLPAQKRDGAKRAVEKRGAWSCSQGAFWAIFEGMRVAFQQSYPQNQLR
jgi:TPR repeat protein